GGSRAGCGRPLDLRASACENAERQCDERLRPDRHDRPASDAPIVAKGSLARFSTSVAQDHQDSGDTTSDKPRRMTPKVLFTSVLFFFEHAEDVPGRVAEPGDARMDIETPALFGRWRVVGRLDLFQAERLAVELAGRFQVADRDAGDRFVLGEHGALLSRGTL